MGQCSPARSQWNQVGVITAAKERLQGRVPHVVTTNVEHPAVIECLVALASEGALLPTPSLPAAPPFASRLEELLAHVRRLGCGAVR